MVNQMPSSSKPRLLARKEAAAFLGLRPQTLAAWSHLRKPHLSYVRIGRRIFYDEDVLAQFIRDNTHGSPPH